MLSHLQPGNVELPDNDTCERVEAFVREGVALEGVARKPFSDPFWAGLRDLGSELWLDTGDMDAAGELWTSQFSALTTNNTLLNKEVQKGIYDDLVKEADSLLSGLQPRLRVLEISFILNVRHGLRLVERFGARVSVELHTALAHDIKATLAYARRCHRICPDNFIVKIPLTPSGLIAARRVGEEGIPVNFTLGFGARQNLLAAHVARPRFVNVFLGRINSFVAQNNLGAGEMAGERATAWSQRAITGVHSDGGEPPRQIAASLRAPSQLAALAGVDVFTMPTTVAAAAPRELAGEWSRGVDESHEITLSPGVDPASVRLEKTWDVSAAEREVFKDLGQRCPDTGRDLVAQLRRAGIEDLFPALSAEEEAAIAGEGKIPVHSRWAERIAAGTAAVDSLLNLAGLASFAADQKALDDRIAHVAGI